MPRLVLLTFLLLAEPLRAQGVRGVPSAPPTARGDQADTLHGKVIPTPYSWLESLDDPPVRAWAAAQTRRTRSALDDSVMRRWFRERIEAHSAPWDRFDAEAAESPTSAIRMRLVPGAGRRRVVVVDSDGRERILADPGDALPGWTVTGITPAPDGQHVIVRAAPGGSEWVTTTIVRVADGVTLRDTLDGILWTSPVWMPDGRAVAYVRYGRPTARDRIVSRGAELRYHRLGTPSIDDRILLEERGDGTLLYALQLTPDGRYLFVSEGTGADTEGLGQLLARAYLVPLIDGVPASPRPLVDDRVAGYALIGTGPDGALHLLTDRDAPRRRIVTVDPAQPDPSAWRDLVPEGPDLIQRVVTLPDRYVLHLLRDASSVVQVRSRSGTLQRTIELPAPVSLAGIERGSTTDTLLLGVHGLLRPPAWHAVHLGDGGTRVDTGVTILRDGPYVVKRVRYPSADGTPIPMWLVHRRDLVRDGSHPVLLSVYGSSHTPTLSEYDERFHAWLDAGGVVGVLNVRGGGEFGRAWWEAATRAHKQRSVDDLIGAAEHLVRERITTPARIGVWGVSFGGMLVSATLAERPDLFGAVVAQVPFADPLRFDLGRHRAQYGDRRDPEQARWLIDLSPQQRLGASRCHPATLVTTAWNDERAPAWMAFTLAATLQSRQTCDRPILLRVDEVGGHLGTPAGYMEHTLDVLTFFARQLGLRPEL